MKKLVLLLLVFVGFLQLGNAQLFITAPNDTIEAIAPPNQLTIFDIYQRNISGGNINLAWTKVSESIPAGWDYSLCDFGTCYPGFPSTGSMNTVTMADSGFIGVNVDPFAFPGTLMVQFYVYEASQPLQGDTITYIISAQPTGIDELASQNLLIYPNPATDLIHFDTKNIHIGFPEKFTIYDMHGNPIVQNKIFSSTGDIDLSTLPCGNYILEIQGSNTIRKSFIKK